MPAARQRSTDKVETDKVVVPVDLFDKDPAELAKNEEDIKRLVAYYRQTRENIRAAEAAGKAINKKTATTKVKSSEGGGSVLSSILASKPSDA